MGFGFKAIQRTRTFIFIRKSITAASWRTSLPLKLKLNQRNYREFPALPAMVLYLRRQAWLALESLHLCSSDSSASGFLSVSNDTDVHPSLDEPTCALNQRVCLNHLGNLHDSLHCQARDSSQEVLICVWEVPGHSPSRVIIQCCCLIPKETSSGNITNHIDQQNDRPWIQTGLQIESLLHQVTSRDLLEWYLTFKPQVFCTKIQIDTYIQYICSLCMCACVCACTWAQWCLILWDPMDSSWPGFSVHTIFWARILKWVTISLL